MNYLKNWANRNLCILKSHKNHNITLLGSFKHFPLFKKLICGKGSVRRKKIVYLDASDPFLPIIFAFRSIHRTLVAFVSYFEQEITRSHLLCIEWRSKGSIIQQDDAIRAFVWRVLIRQQLLVFDAAPSLAPVVFIFSIQVSYKNETINTDSIRSKARYLELMARSLSHFLSSSPKKEPLIVC